MIVNPLTCQKIEREFRRLATGFCFLTFICGGFVLTVTALPLILVFSSTPEQRETWTLKLIRFCFKWFMWYMEVMTPIASFKIEGLENCASRKGCLFIANHPTLIDVVAILGYIPLCHCIIKTALLEHIYLGSLMRAAGYLANEHATQLVEDCTQSLQSGRAILIFPEGTRSPAHNLLPFNRGAAQIALRTGAPIIPIVITCDPPTLLKDEPWYAVPDRAVHYVLRFHPPLSIPQSVTDKAEFPLQVRALNRHFEDFFQRQLSQVDPQHAVAQPHQS